MTAIIALDFQGCKDYLYMYHSMDNIFLNPLRIIRLGYTFSYKYHRKGYAFEALTVLHEYLHKMAPEWEFITYTECENIASIKMLKKLGYKNLGYVPSIDSQAFGKWTTLVTEKKFAR